METYAARKRRSQFANSLKSQLIYKRLHDEDKYDMNIYEYNFYLAPRQYENREDSRLRQYESRKATW